MRSLKPWYFRLHRWLALTFALPLLLVIGSGVILSFEPLLVGSAIEPNSLSTERVLGLVQQADPDGKATMISYRSYDGTLSVGVGRGASTTVDVATGEPAAPSALATLMGTARGIHERLMLDAEWLVIASTIAMLLLVGFGALMGIPRIANTLGGWHKAMAWGLLPLMVLSPLTGLMLAFGITFTTATTPPGGPMAGQATQPLSLTQAVETVGQDHDLSSLIWIRKMGPRVMARLAEDGAYKVYTVGQNGLTATASNWPRLWHEGNFSAWAPFINIATSISMLGLLISGLWLWARRQIRRSTRKPLRIARA